VDNLPIYTTERAGIKLRADPYFAAALTRAQFHAKATVGSTDLSTATTPAVVEELTGSNGIKTPGARLLLLLCWHFASRVGDMRQVRVSDVVLRDAPSSMAERVLVRITFRRGKVSTITGPITLVAYVPKRVASAITEYKKDKSPADDMFSCETRRSCRRGCAR
jgi:hypothetical protein